jgi:hypothetical protein
MGISVAIARYLREVSSPSRATVRGTVRRLGPRGDLAARAEASCVNDDRYLQPRLLQSIGVGLLLGFAVFWAITGRESVLLVGAAGSLILLGRTRARVRR